MRILVHKQRHFLSVLMMSNMFFFSSSSSVNWKKFQAMIINIERMSQFLCSRNGFDETYVRPIFNSVQRLAVADVLCLMRYICWSEREGKKGEWSFVASPRQSVRSLSPLAMCDKEKREKEKIFFLFFPFGPVRLVDVRRSARALLFLSLSFSITNANNYLTTRHAFIQQLQMWRRSAQQQRVEYRSTPYTHIYIYIYIYFVSYIQRLKQQRSQHQQHLAWTKWWHLLKGF